ncbi:ribosome biogenesis protein tsr1, variant 2 [Entomophthora muscae]|uniref:Ribosome biogenesis protein tsr1, variant 2 n=1 Tax=Entomophthora muscae TaxID=34485 RepID=A0ACC2U850_9FUNG|nr:ribosome biogenesis protein tsr1, variant 2 [Entomophthora muscae]
MGKATSFHHRPSLKQTNKAFKSKFASKSSLKDKAKGKVEKTIYKPTGAKSQLNKSDRKNAAKMIQRNKKEALASTNKLFNGKNGIFKIVALVPLSPDVTAFTAAERFFASAKKPFPSDTFSPVLRSEALKQNIQFLCPDRNLYDVMDACKVADYVVFILSGEVEVDSFGELCISSVQSQGIPNSYNLAANLDHLSTKRQVEVKKSLSSFMSYFFPENDKIHALENDQEVFFVLRSIVSQTPKHLPWRENHPYLLADKVEYVVNPENPTTGTLIATGFIRGKGMSANRLVHLQNLGDFQLTKIEKQPIPGVEYHKGNEAQNEVLDIPTPELQDTLVCENIPDVMEGEQTWPTEEELREADSRVESMGIAPEAPSRKRMVVKGTSSYQAAWIVESDGDASEDGVDEDMDCDSGSEAAAEEFVEMGADNDDQSVAEEHEPLDAEEDLQQYEAYMKQRREEYLGDHQFPDEVDTPRDIPARTRFQRYRGLLSMRTSPWDAYENLPMDYSRIFQFQNFFRTRRRVLALADEAPTKVGTYASVHIANVPRSFGGNL